VLGRRAVDSPDSRPVGRLGCYRATDGSDGAPVGVDLAGPHAALVVGKRGSGKSYTLGVLAEELAASRGVAPVVADPMGAFAPLAEAGWRVVEPTVRADALDGRAWCGMLGLAPESGAGALVWQAAAERPTLEGMRAFVAAADAPDAARRGAANHLRLAASWDVFAADGFVAADLAADPTVLALAGLERAPMNAVVRAVGTALYDGRVADRLERLPWLLVDEAHAFFGGVAEPALRRLLTRGRAPGVSLVAATQRPAGLPDVAVSQADLLVAHRLTGEADRAALASARPSYLHGSLGERLPDATGEALVFDDATERAHQVRVRERRTEHGGESPQVGDERRGNQ